MGFAHAFVAHWSPLHAVANAFAIAFLGGLLAWREGIGRLATVMLAAAAAQVIALAGFSTATEFRGASGFAYAIAAYLLAMSARRAAGMALGLAACGGFYLVAGARGVIASSWLPVGVTPDVPVHVAGALAGLAIALCRNRRDHWHCPR